MRNSTAETIVGALVVALAAVFLWYAFNQGGDASSRGDQYDLSARFSRAGGIDRGTDVRIAGVKAGIVTQIEGDPERFDAIVKMRLDSKWKLPGDTDARIVSDGLLGGAYVELEPGAEDAVIAQDGTGEIIYTQGNVDLLTLFASFMSGGGGESAADDVADETALETPE